MQKIYQIYWILIQKGPQHILQACTAENTQLLKNSWFPHTSKNEILDFYMAKNIIFKALK